MVISNEMTPPQLQGGDKKKISVYARFSPKRPGQPQLTTAEVLSEENNDAKTFRACPLDFKL